MYMYCSGSARDRAGLIFRLASAEMYKRLGLGSSVVPKTRSVYSEEARLRLRSRAAWGLFCQET